MPIFQKKKSTIFFYGFNIPEKYMSNSSNYSQIYKWKNKEEKKNREQSLREEAPAPGMPAGEQQLCDLGLVEKVPEETCSSGTTDSRSTLKNWRR
jgi:hypothetical protein